MCLHSVKPCLIYRGELTFLKNHRNESSRSLCKLHGRRGESIQEGKHCFSFTVYWHCGNNGLYSASLAFMFIFLLIPFDAEIVTLLNQISGWSYFLKCFLQKKHVMLFCNLLNVKKYLPSLLNYLDVLSRGQKSWLIKNYWINNNQSKCIAKTCVFCMQNISHKSNQGEY